MLFALLVSGCAGGGSGVPGGEQVREGEQVSAVVVRYFSALARDSATDVCPLLIGSAQRKMVEVVESDEQELGRSSTVHTCVQAARFFGGVPQFENAKVISASVTRTNATVTVKVGSLHVASVTLSKTATGWLINKLPGEE
jgi:hypothetical protein